MKYRVWWIPQLPMKAFTVDVDSVIEGVKVMDVLADYDLFQYENNVKGDYCNTGGLLMFDADDKEDSPDGSWVDWSDSDSGEDDPRQYLNQ